MRNGGTSFASLKQYTESSSDFVQQFGCWLAFFKEGEVKIQGRGVGWVESPRSFIILMVIQVGLLRTSISRCFFLFFLVFRF